MVRVIISAGGTGGHIYPALALINKIKQKEPGSEFLFIGSHNRMEKDIIPKQGIEYIPLTIIGFKRKLTFHNFKTIKYFIKAVKDAKKIIHEFKPDVVIGFGGYICSPVLYAASKLGYPTLIHEQNSRFGLANRFLGRYVSKIALSFPLAEIPTNLQAKTVYTGNPCSEQVLTVSKLDKTKLGLTPNKQLVVMVMGSLGSSTINDKMKVLLPLFNNQEYEVLYITGKNDAAAFKTLKLGSNLKVVPYIEDFNALMQVTDLIISRAGATTLSQIIALNLPAILIPSPYVANNHQLKNAKRLNEKGAALIIEETELKGDILVRTVAELLSNKKKYANIKNNLKQLATPHSATKLYNTIKELVDGSKQ